MGDMADHNYEVGSEALIMHLAGMCDDDCLYCGWEDDGDWICEDDFNQEDHG